jgi:predicted MPP superfamily phosphohydrolase
LPRFILIAAFIAVLLLVVIGGHFYLAQHLVIAPALPQPWRGLALAMIAGGGALLVLQPIVERTQPLRLARWINWPASLWMGVAFYLLLFSSASQLAQALRGVLFDAGASRAAARAWAAVVVAAASAAAVRGVRTALREPLLERRELRLPRWPPALNGFRIVQISDIHIGPILDRRFAARLVERCNALRPDLIAVTGDLVDGDVTRVADEVEPFARLRAAHGVYFVTGNHDYYSGSEPWVAQVEKLGMRVLRNRRVTIGRDGAAFDLAGVEDHHAHLVSSSQREDLHAALDGRDTQRAVVLLAHDPLTFKEAARLGVDLQLSGHTHGGQIWPFRYLKRLSTPYVVGHFPQRLTALRQPRHRLLGPGDALVRAGRDH